ncbi:MAG: DMT family transporter, partial [Chloroflexi bacterium]|nr:DMT family transporter [Chloroflexota bacterium]
IDPLNGIFWGSLGLLSWGFADYLARSVAVRVGSMSTAVLIQVLGLALPLPFVLAGLGANGLEADWGAVALWAPLSAACLGLAYLAYYTGLHRGAVSVVTSAASAWLAVTVAVTVLFFGEHISLLQVGLMGAVLAGILMLSAQPSTRSGANSGLLWGLGAMFGLGLALGFLDRITEASSPMFAVLIVRALSIVPAYLFTRYRGEVIRLPSGWDGKRLLIAAALLDSGGYVAYNLGVDAAPVAVVAPITAAHPVVTIALAIVLLRERPRSLQWAGAGVTVAAVVALSAFAGA